MFTDTVQCQTV